MVNERAVKLFDDLAELLKDFIRRHELTYEEYRGVVMFLHELGQTGEVPLLLDVFFESTVNEVNFGHKPGTPAAVEGPYYVPDAPELQAPYELPRREDEPGEVLVIAGSVRSSDGRPLDGALLDIWQADADGCYSNVQPTVPPYNLRGKVRTDKNGSFEVRTVLPAPYEIPKSGPTGKLLEVLGRHAFRPAHVHFKVSHEDHEVLTTQLYFQGGEWLGSDVAGADTNATLAVAIERGEAGARIGFDFVLAQVGELRR